MCGHPRSTCLQTRRFDRTLPADERSRFVVTIDARVGDVAENILETARERKVDLIVMGTHGRHGLAHLLRALDVCIA